MLGDPMKLKLEQPRGSEITPEGLYVERRRLIQQAGLVVASGVVASSGIVELAGCRERVRPVPPPSTEELTPSVRGRFPPGKDDAKSSYPDITGYNNFYELGVQKGDPERFGNLIHRRPWVVHVEGEVSRPSTIDLDDFYRWFDLEERIYRLRSLEGWSMVVPWLGFPLADLLQRLSPSSQAKFVEFTTLHDPAQLPNQKSDVLPWPYVEALRIDEASNPLTFMALGLYGKRLRGQNGAPIRLVVPWKYGFKSIKSIVKIRFTREQPKTTWTRVAPAEHGFYANVNPKVPHPRWTQATERRFGEVTLRDTLPFNGYGEHVAGLYLGMDLARNY
jgi:sulfoxide reductase catalytic subunit YedY